MLKLRMRFAKTGRAVYISHLDLMHTFHRVFLRADYPLKHSDGFNPHPILSIAVPPYNKSIYKTSIYYFYKKGNCFL